MIPLPWRYQSSFSEDAPALSCGMTEHNARVAALAAARFRIAAILTALMILLYFGFVSLVAFNKPLLARLVTRGLSLGILLGALVIVVSWLLTWFYVRWSNEHYDPELERLRNERPEAGPAR
jgi:uncharacterized membrane protein (DUF485 family)